MMNIWLGDPEAYFLGRKNLVPPSKITGIRRMEHADLPHIEQLMRPETYEIFGDVNLGSLYERSCLSVVLCNEKSDIVSGMCLCNYPNVPSVIPEDWMHWLYTLYNVENVTERNSKFIHNLVWDKRYTGQFFEIFLTGLFDIASYLQHILLVVPPWIILADVFEGQMIVVPSKFTANKSSTQTIYITERHLKNPRLKIRRIVEEDNDNVIPIVGEQTSLLQEFYGEFYVSEMVRYPNNRRQLIVSEDSEGLATGVMFLNSAIDVDTLNQNFELVPYNGLRKPHANDVFPPGYMTPASETFFSIFSKKPREETMEESSTMKADEEIFDEMTDITSSTASTSIGIPTRKSMEPSQTSFISEIASISDYYQVYYQSKVMTSAFLDTVVAIPRKTTISPSLELSETISVQKVKFSAQPTYYGKVNAFALEILATQKQIKHRSSKNFLEAAFECFPDLDYCAILIPSSHPYLHFLEYFVRVPYRCDKDYPMTLYVTHRAALLGQIKFREAELSDREEVEELLQRIPRAEQILIDFDTAVKKEQQGMYCYVFQWKEIIIGVTIVCLEKEVTYIKRRYHVEDYIVTQNIPRDSYGRILHFALQPIFSIHLRYFFCEITRFSGITVLFYRIMDDALSALTRTHSLTNCLNCMVPVNPRQRIEYKYHGFEETDEPEEKPEPFALFMTTPRLARIPNLIVDSKIVVVGASDCGVAFVEQLAFGQSFMRFMNLTLISSNGLPFGTENMGECMIPFRGRYCRRYRRRVAVRAWINIVYGTVLTIHRKEKYVTVMNQGNIAYDYLILTCGLQYQKPRFQNEIEEQRKGIFLEYETPWNCITINDDTEAAECLKKMQTLKKNSERERNIIFYGHNIDCYCALQGLLDFGIKGSWITLILPPLQQCAAYDTVFFENCEVYVEVMNSISRNDIQILVGWEMIDWYLKDSQEGKMIESIVFKLKGKTKTIDCDVLFNFHEKTINMKIFLAICRSGLVFDGQLVIDPELRTNDPWIFAAGTMTKYCKKFHTEQSQHMHYNSIEVGEKLAAILQAIIKKQHREGEAPFEPFKGKSCLKIPVFRSSKIVACTLPGGYRYLHVYKPGTAAMHNISQHDIYKKVLVTGSSTSEIGYFRIRLNQYDAVETITCFSKKDFEMHHIIMLHGKHESLLNELKNRFEESLIVDFYAYFREPWAMAIFHDRFECLRVENRATLLSKTAIPGESLVNDCMRALIKSDWNEMHEDDRRRIQWRYAGSVYQQEIEENLLDFLQFCESDLPVYCTPGKLRELSANNEDSPLYTAI